MISNIKSITFVFAHILISLSNLREHAPTDILILAARVNIWKHDSRTEFFACRGRYSREHPIQRQKPSNLDPGWIGLIRKWDTGRHSWCAGSSLAPAPQGPCRPTHPHIYARTQWSTLARLKNTRGYKRVRRCRSAIWPPP